jgi:hypothetical protein
VKIAILGWAALVGGWFGQSAWADAGLPHLSCELKVWRQCSGETCFDILEASEAQDIPLEYTPTDRKIFQVAGGWDHLGDVSDPVVYPESIGYVGGLSGHSAVIESNPGVTPFFLKLELLGFEARFPMLDTPDPANSYVQIQSDNRSILTQGAKRFWGYVTFGCRRVRAGS